jgi:Gpi18-like mannosyltransferase
LGNLRRLLDRQRALAPLLVVGLLLRLLMLTWPPFPVDMTDWIAWGERMLQVGPARFYSESVFADYAPGYLYVTWLVAALKNGLLPGTGRAPYELIYRLIPIGFDLLTAVLIARIVTSALQRGAADDPAFVRRAALLAAAGHALNPAVIFNSAAWGQIDGVFTFFALLALDLLLRGRAEWAVCSYVVAFLIKPQSISLAPLIGLTLLLRYPAQRWLRAGAAGLALAYVALLPFFGLNPFGLVELLQRSVETYPYTSLFTYNLWGIYGFWRDDTVASSLGPSLRTLGTLLYLVGLVYGCAALLRRLWISRDDPATVYIGATYFAFLPVMVLTRMHERYLYPVLPLLLISVFAAWRPAAPLGLRRFVLSLPSALFAVLTALHTLNLYHVYTFYQNDQRVPRSNALFYFIDSQPKLWSALTLLIFAIVAGWLAVGVRLWPARLPASARGEASAVGASPPERSGG